MKVELNKKSIQKSQIIILGGGQTGAYAANEIRKHDKESLLTIINEEKYTPYERPPLSKDCLLGKKEYGDLSFFSKEKYKDDNVNILNQKVKNVDFKNNTLSFSNYEDLIYDRLLIATGSKNRELHFNNNLDFTENDILYLRTIEDSKKIKEKIEQSKSIAIIGGGFIGLEIASSVAQLGKNAFVIEIADQLMGRIIPSQIASFIAQYHKNNGNKILLNSKITKISKKNNSYQIYLSDNTEINIDAVIAGIGSMANTEIFKNTSLKLDNGILTDEYCRTSEDNVFAAGDVSNFFHPFYNSYLRLESYRHAQNHGICAAKNILGIKTSYQDIPWMWSDQFNLNLQLTGLCNKYENIVKRGEKLEDGVLFFFLKNKKIVGACGLGVSGKIGKDISIAGKLSEKNITVSDEDLSNTNIKLNKLLKK